MQTIDSIQRIVRHKDILQFLAYHSQWRLYGYTLLAFGIFIEGDAVLYTAGFLAHRGVFDPSLTFFWLLAGATLGDIVWYNLGSYLETQDNTIVRWLKKATNPFGLYLTNHPKKSLFISKFLYGVNHAILCKAGAMQTPLKTFIRNDLPANLLWIVIVGGLGYASSAGLVHMRHPVRMAELGLFVGILVIMFIFRIMAYIFKQKL